MTKFRIFLILVSLTLGVKRVASSTASSPVTNLVAELTLPVLHPDDKSAAFELKHGAKLNNWMFFYGTLKHGERNHFFVRDAIRNGTVKFVGHATAVERYPLILRPPYNIPTILYRPRAGERVRGELYLVSDELRADLDKFEEHPQAYQRYPIRVERTKSYTNSTDDDAILGIVPLRCHVYLLFDYAPHLLDLKSYGNYANNDLPPNMQIVETKNWADYNTTSQLKEATASLPAAVPDA